MAQPLGTAGQQLSFLPPRTRRAGGPAGQRSSQAGAGEPRCTRPTAPLPLRGLQNATRPTIHAPRNASAPRRPRPAEPQWPAGALRSKRRRARAPRARCGARPRARARTRRPCRSGTSPTSPSCWWGRQGRSRRPRRRTWPLRGEAGVSGRGTAAARATRPLVAWRRRGGGGVCGRCGVARARRTRAALSRAGARARARAGGGAFCAAGGASTCGAARAARHARARVAGRDATRAPRSELDDIESAMSPLGSGRGALILWHDTDDEPPYPLQRGASQAARLPDKQSSKIALRAANTHRDHALGGAGTLTRRYDTSRLTLQRIQFGGGQE